MESTTNMTKMVEALTAATIHTASHRRELCDIAVSDKSDAEKVRAIRTSILKYTAQPLSLTEQSWTEEQRAEFHADIGKIAPDDTDVEAARMMFMLMGRPIKEHSRLLDRMAEVIRSDLSNEEKVDALSNLLL